MRQRGMEAEASSPPNPPSLNDDRLPLVPMSWAERLSRVFQIDITNFPDCGGRLQWTAG